MSFNNHKETEADSTCLSMYDLLSQPEFKKAMLEGDYHVVDKLLFSVGVDVELEYQVVNRLHRPLSTKEIVNCGVLIYTERTDKEWIKSGAASMEAIIRSTGDASIRAEMIAMQDAYMSTDKMLKFLNK